MQLSPRNKDAEILVDYETRETITLNELMPKWWGDERYAEQNVEQRIRNLNNVRPKAAESAAFEQKN